MAFHGDDELFAYLQDSQEPAATTPTRLPVLATSRGTSPSPPAALKLESPQSTTTPADSASPVSVPSTGDEPSGSNSGTPSQAVPASEDAKNKRRGGFVKRPTPFSSTAAFRSCSTQSLDSVQTPTKEEMERLAEDIRKAKTAVDQEGKDAKRKAKDGDAETDPTPTAEVKAQSGF